MAVQSAFQRLPLHISERIVRFFIYKSGVFDIPILIESAEQLHAWRILYDTCYSWRILALEHFCREIELELSTRPERRILAYNCLPPDIEASVEQHRLVKQVNLVFGDISNSSQKEQHQLLQETWPESVAFPSARTLSISIEGDAFWGVIVDVPIASELFEWVSERVLESMPKLYEAHINRSSLTRYKIASERKQSSEKTVNRLFQVVLDRVKRFVVYTSPTRLYPCDSYFQNSPGLVRLDYDCRYNVEFLHFVICKTALTLVKLKVHRFPMERVKLLVFCSKDSDDETLIIYSQLRSLYIDASMDAGAKHKILVDRYVAPFPVLRKLWWKAPYPFKDDTLFRANSTTLEYLNISSGEDLLDALQKRSDIPNCGYLNVCDVVAKYQFEDDPEPEAYGVLEGFTAKFVSSATRYFWTDIPYSFQNIINIIGTRSFAENIQDLTLEQTTLSLVQVIELVKRLPRMTRLSCIYGKVDAEFDGKPTRAVTDQLYKGYYPLSRCFKVYDLACEDESTTHTDICIAAIALSILCPNFVHVSYPCGDIKSTHHELKRVIECGGYDESVERVVDPFDTGPIEL